MKQRWGAMMLIAVLSFVCGGWLVRREPSADGDVYQRARLFEDVLTTIQKHYVDTTSETELYRQATQQLITSLRDPYAELLVGDAYRQYREQIAGTRRQSDSETGRGRGIGPTTGVLLSPGEVRVPAVGVATLLDHGIGYVALRTVSRSASAEVAEAIEALRASGMKRLVLDLRFNPGGLISEGTAVADLFLDRGDTIATTRGRIAEHSRVYIDRSMQRWPDLPVVVLVNRGTASAAELITTALQDHDRAAVIGMNSYGKGVVQTTFRLGDDVALKLTTARWYGPSGRSIQRPLPAGLAEWAPLLVPGETPGAALGRFRSSAGRPLPASAGIVPDLIVRQTPLTEDERQFVGVAAADPAMLHRILADCARDLKSRQRPATEAFVVTAEMRAAVRTQLERDGVHIAEPIFSAATAYVDQTIGYAVAREVFGEAAETRRRARDDRQLTTAASLLIHARTAGDPIALAATR